MLSFCYYFADGLWHLHLASAAMSAQPESKSAMDANDEIGAPEELRREINRAAARLIEICFAKQDAEARSREG
jgi:hypothetical protein